MTEVLTSDNSDADTLLLGICYYLKLSYSYILGLILDLHAPSDLIYFYVASEFEHIHRISVFVYAKPDACTLPLSSNYSQNVFRQQFILICIMKFTTYPFLVSAVNRQLIGNLKILYLCPWVLNNFLSAHGHK